MSQASPTRHTLRFAVFEVDLSAGEIRKQGLRIRLQEQPFAVLAALLETPGEVVSREALIRRLWPDGTVVDFDRGLNAAVTRLRQALSDSAETPRYIETVARRGYRFIGVLIPDELPARLATAAAPAPVDEPSSGRLTKRPWYAAAVAAVLLTAGGVWVYSPRTRPAARAWRVTPLTTYSGRETHVTFSPDGAQVAYQGTTGQDGPFVFIKLAGPGDPIRLTSSSLAEYSPAWSPDGQFIAFSRKVDEQTLGIFVIPALGGVDRKIAEFPLTDTWIWAADLRAFAWTPDSRHLVVSGPERPGETERLALVSVGNGEKRWLTRGPGDSHLSGDRDPDVSPDGRSIAFVRGEMKTVETIHVLPLGTGLLPAGEPAPLDTGGPSRNPVWAPDSRTIVYKPLRANGLASIDIRTGERRDLPELGDNLLLPAFARTGRLAFSRVISDMDIWRYEIGGASTRLISSTARDVNPQYSPDGSRIAFQSDRSGWPEIWACDAGGAHCSQITSFEGPFITGTPRWSPDGKRIAFDSGATGRFNIYTIDAAGGPVQRVTPDFGAIPSWSHDGKWIYCIVGRAGSTDIWKFASGGGGTPVQVTRNGGFVAFESPDGRFLYYTKSESDGTLWRSAPDGSGETEILRGVAHRGFSLAQDRIYYLKSTPNRTTEIRRFLLATREDSRLTEIHQHGYLGLSLSPDGRYLLFDRLEQSGSDLMLAQPQ